MSKLLSILQTQGFVDDSNDKIVELGLQRLKTIVLDILFSLLVSFLFGDLIVGILFELSYCILRVYAGGYHAPTKFICTWFSYISVLLFLILIFFLPLGSIAMHMLLCAAMLSIVLFSPVENKNKPLSSREKQVYRRNSLLIAAMELAAYLLLFFNNTALYAKTICLAICLVAIGQIADVLQKKITKNSH